MRACARDLRRPSPPPPPQRGCHVAAHQGRRRSQEDRTFCALGIRIPFIAIDATSSSLLAMEYFDHLTAKFQRFLVEAKCKRFGCIYLSENLNEDMDYIFRAPEVYHNDDIHDLNETSPEPVLSYPSARPLELYKDQRFCWHFGPQDIEKGQCTSPEIFAKFVGLLDSLPSNDSKSRSPVQNFYFVDWERFLGQRT